MRLDTGTKGLENTNIVRLCHQTKWGHRLPQGEGHGGQNVLIRGIFTGVLGEHS